MKQKSVKRKGGKDDERKRSRTKQQMPGKGRLQKEKKMG